MRKISISFSNLPPSTLPFLHGDAWTMIQDVVCLGTILSDSRSELFSQHLWMNSLVETTKPEADLYIDTYRYSYGVIN